MSNSTRLCSSSVPSQHASWHSPLSPRVKLRKMCLLNHLSNVLIGVCRVAQSLRWLSPYYRNPAGQLKKVQCLLVILGLVSSFPMGFLAVPSGLEKVGLFLSQRLPHAVCSLTLQFSIIMVLRGRKYAFRLLCLLEPAQMCKKHILVTQGSMEIPKWLLYSQEDGSFL